MNTRGDQIGIRVTGDRLTPCRGQSVGKSRHRNTGAATPRRCTPGRASSRSEGCCGRRSGGCSMSPCWGREKLEAVRGPFVVVSNHTSHLDAPLIIGALPRRLSRYVAAGAAADYFFDVWWRKGLTSLFFNAFPVDRTGLRGRRGLATSLLDDGVPAAAVPRGHPVAHRRDGQLQARRGRAVHQPRRPLPAGRHRRRLRGDAVRAELAEPRTPAGLADLRRTAARRGRRDASPSSTSGSPKRSPASSTTRTTTGRGSADARAPNSSKEKATMPAVKHMKWWGWGVDGVSFHHEDKPALGPFVREGHRRRRHGPRPTAAL